MAGVVGLPAPSSRLPPLRQDLALYPADVAADGSPAWTLHDPAGNRFYRLGWAAFEMLSRWHLGTPEAVAAALRAETTLESTPGEVADLAQMLQRGQLCEVLDAAGSRALLAQHRAGRQSRWKWLLEHYLFFRVPVWRPARLMQFLVPWSGWAFARWFHLLVLGLGIVGLFLLSRQWDGFLGSFQAFDHWSGFLGLGLALSFSKVLHEFGHALAATRHGCKVPTMGVAFLVMWPVLYTDVNEAWMLPRRRQRLAIAGAGIVTELGLALLATFLWSFLPEGPWKAAAFFLATSTWLITLGINASPFMRFDGYFLLCDWLGIDNLHQRAFAFGRWRLREFLFGLGHPAPETGVPARFLTLFAYATWIYRLVLFLGIALLVYHFFFKLLGIFLMLVELGWFIARPLAQELGVWWRMREEIMKSPRGLAVLLLLPLLFAGLLAAPWQITARAPAMLTLEQRQAVHAPVAGRLLTPPPTPGQQVKAGEILWRLHSPEVEFQLGHARLREQPLRWRQEHQSLHEDLRKEGGVTARRAEAAAESISAWSREKDRYAIPAPLQGVVLEVNPEVSREGWVAADEWLALVGRPGAARVEAYVAEADLERVQPGAAARFTPESPEWPAFTCRVAEIDRANVDLLEHPALALAHGGPLATKGDDRTGLIPAQSHYRARLDHCQPAPPALELRGTAHIDAERASLGAVWWRAIRGVWARESGF